jgi:hypothetical protein
LEREALAVNQRSRSEGERHQAPIQGRETRDWRHGRQRRRKREEARDQVQVFLVLDIPYCCERDPQLGHVPYVRYLLESENGPYYLFKVPTGNREEGLLYLPTYLPVFCFFVFFFSNFGNLARKKKEGAKQKGSSRQINKRENIIKSQYLKDGF